jgi:DNA-binding HxlR family transcriptional regulator
MARQTASRGAGTRDGLRGESGGGALGPEGSGGKAGADNLVEAEQTTAFDNIIEPCRGIDILKRVGDKWSVYAIHMLGLHGTLRFGELQRQIDGISQRMLSVTLRALERDGLVLRKMYPEVPPRVEYTLTPLGKTLRRAVGELVAWSVTHRPEIEAARERYDEQEQGWASEGE